MGGAIAAIESGYMKRELVKSNSARLRAIETGETVVVGVNAFTESEPRRFERRRPGGAYRLRQCRI